MIDVGRCVFGTDVVIVLDFVASASVKTHAAPPRRMTRNQQIRELQQHAYMRQTLDPFDAAVTNFYKRHGGVSSIGYVR